MIAEWETNTLFISDLLEKHFADLLASLRAKEERKRSPDVRLFANANDGEQNQCWAGQT